MKQKKKLTPLQKAKAKIKELKAENMAFDTRIATLERSIEYNYDCRLLHLERQIKGYKRDHEELQDNYIKKMLYSIFKTTAKLAKLIR